MNLHWWGIKAQNEGLGIKMWENKDVDPTILLYSILALLAICVAIGLLAYLYISSKRRTKLENQIYKSQEETKPREENSKDHLAAAQLKILSMLEDGKITPHECGDLLAALIEKKVEKEPSVESDDSTSSNVHQAAASINDGD